MKLSILLVLAALALPSQSPIHAQSTCIQVIQSAVSPGGVCQEYATPCEVPTDWKAVPSCDLIDQTDQANQPSLEQKMQSRRDQMRAYWTQKKAAQSGIRDTASNASFSKIGSGSFTRSDRNRRLPTSNNNSSFGIRAFTEKDYHSDISKRYSQRGGYQRAGDTTSAERKERRAYRAPIQSRSDAKRTGNLNTTVKWDVMSRQFTNPKNYGINPYRLSSKYKEQQKAKRAKSNQEIDVHERMMSRSRKYRGKRLEGNMSGNDLLDN